MRKDNKIQAKRKRPARKELLRAKRGKKVLKKNSPSKLLPRPPTREAKAEGKLGTACMAKVFEAQLEAAQEIAFDPVLNETCSKDVERLCKDVEPGEGRIQECLVSGRRSGQSTQFLNEWFWAAGVNSMSRAAVEAGFVLSLGYGASRSAS